jgi:hypothetical protein
VGVSWIRSAAISCLIACGAMVAGPGVVGGAVASADLFGIDLDIFDIFCHNEKKCEGNDNRRGAPDAGGDPPEVRINGGTVGTEAPKRGLPEEPTRGLPEEPTRGLPGATGGGGADVPRSGGTDRPANLPPVPTAPGSREIVIRGEPTAPVPSAPAPAAPAPAVPAPAAPPPAVPIPAPVVVPPVVVPPVVVPPVVVPPVVVPPMMPPAPAIGPVVPPPPPMVHPPSLTPPPRVDRQPAPTGELGPQGIPVTFRDGYADYLKAATVAELAPVALSGTAGILAITALGGLVGFRQARAAQALPPANITNVVRFLQ